MEKYAREHVARLLRRLAYQVNRTSKNADADAVHDLRVSIRRFSASLRIFGQFFPRPKVKKIRRQAKRMMDCAARVRDLDIALELLGAAGPGESSTLAREWRTERDAAEKRIRTLIRQWSRRDFSRRWRVRLGL